ncbi:MAG: chemotaxis protein CheW [Nitrosomonas sp.]|nr:chemotaxis protein CheW [Nitrosomonas sp.]
MRNKPSIMLDYQLALNAQIDKPHPDQPETVPVLGFAVGDDRWLVTMNEIGKVMPVPKITSVFLTRPWFLGMINVHGNPYGLCDLAQFTGAPPIILGTKTRIILAASRLHANCAILTSSMLGIRSMSEFSPSPDSDDPRSFVTAIYNDRQNRTWRMLNLARLVRLQSFHQIAR